jgi:hypothetical protein
MIQRVLSAVQPHISVRCSESSRIWISRFIGSVDAGKRERKISFMSEARGNRSDGNFDGTNNAIVEYFLEEVHQKNCNQKRELNVERFFCRHH